MMTRFARVLLILMALLLVAGVNLSVLAKGKPEAPPGQAKKATVGNVEEVSGNTLTVSDKGKKETKAEVGKTTKLVGQDKKISSVKQIKVKDKVAILSEESSDSGKIKKAVKVFVKEATAAAQLKKKAVHGVITGISGSTLTVAHQIQRERINQVLVTASTLIKMKSSGVGSEATGSAGAGGLTVGMRIVAVGEPNAAGALVARRIHVIPGKATGIFRRLPVASPSGTPATTSGTPATGSGTPVGTDSGTPATTSGTF